MLEGDKSTKSDRKMQLPFIQLLFAPLYYVYYFQN